MLPTMSARFTCGMKICPASSFDVCVTVSRGEYPSCMAWCVSENAPEMSACDAITAAAVARIEHRVDAARRE